MRLPRYRIQTLMLMVAAAGLILGATLSLGRIFVDRQRKCAFHEAEAQRLFRLASSYPPGHALRELHAKQAIARQRAAWRFYIGARRPWRSLPESNELNALIRSYRPDW